MTQLQTQPQSEFAERVAEIEAFLTFISQVELGNVRLMQGRQGQETLPAFSSNDQANLLRTFKASAFLLLYNLMESTATNAIDAIFDEFARQGTQFDACRSEIRRVILSNLKQHDINNILPQLTQLSMDVMTKTFLKDKVLSGNVDARKIRELADEYGFPHPAADGRDLLVVKTNRNDLAHGSKSFADVGRDYTVTDIIAMKDKIIIYLKAMLDNVADYILGKQYLAAQAAGYVAGPSRE